VDNCFAVLLCRNAKYCPGCDLHLFDRLFSDIMRVKTSFSLVHSLDACVGEPAKHSTRISGSHLHTSSQITVNQITMRNVLGVPSE